MPKQKLPLPVRADLDDGTLDGTWAADRFLGLSLAQAEELIRESPIQCFEDLQSMRPRGAAFYVRAMARYLCSEAARGDRQSAEQLQDLVRLWLDEGRRFGVAIDDLQAALNRMQQQSGFYVACRDDAGVRTAFSRSAATLQERIAATHRSP